MPKPNPKSWFQKSSLWRRKEGREGKAPRIGERSAESVGELSSGLSTASGPASAQAPASMAGETPNTPNPELVEERPPLEASAQIVAHVPPSSSHTTNSPETTQTVALESSSSLTHGALTNPPRIAEEAGGQATVKSPKGKLRDYRAVDEGGNSEPLGGVVSLNFTRAQVQVHGPGDVGCGNHIITINNNYIQDPSGKRYEAAKWLYSFAPKQREIHNSLLNLRAQDTGGYVLAFPEFKQWENGESLYLECTGMPGAGKSMAAAIVIDHLQLRQDSPTVLSFFCKYDAAWSHSVDRVLASFLGQLVHCRSDISKSISALYDEYRSLPDTIPPLRTIFNALKSEIDSAENAIFLVIDALDEFSLKNDGRHQHLIEQIEKLRVPVMVTSRKPVPFTDELRGHVCIYAKDDDIVRYMQERCRHGPWSDVLKSFGDLQKEVCEGVRKNAEGMFLVAHLQADVLQTCRGPLAIRSALGKLPPGLEGTYKAAIQRIRDKGEHDFTAATCVFSWILCINNDVARWGLWTDLAQQAVALATNEPDIPMKDHLLDICEGLVVADKSVHIRGSFKFVHYSTNEFFTNNQSTYLPHAQHDIVKICLQCMELSTLRHDYSSLLLWYSRMFWGFHARECHEDFDVNFALDVYRDISHRPGRPTFMPYHISKSAFSLLPSSPTIPFIYFDLAHSLEKISDRTEFATNDGDIINRGLMYAVYHRAKDVSALFIRKGADVNAQCANGINTLTYAVHANDQDPEGEMIQLLLEHGATLDLEPIGSNAQEVFRNRAHTPFTVALDCLNLGALKLFAKRKYYRQEDHVIWMSKSLLCAAKRGSLDYLRFFLEEGAEVDWEDEDGRTPLSFASERQYENRVGACKTGSPEVVKFLLHRGANPHKADKRGRTPLWYASSWSNPNVDCIKMLLDRGADANISDDAGMTPLSCMGWPWGGVEPMRLIVEAGANVNVMDRNGQTAISHFAQAGNVECVGFLLESGAMVDFPDKMGRTPLSYACSAYRHSDHPDACISLLLDQGARADSCDKDGRTPLSYAAESRRVEVVERILQGIPVDEPDKEGRAPISYAAHGHKKRVMELLVQKGADVHRFDNNGRSLLSHAVDRTEWWHYKRGSDICDTPQALIAMGLHVDSPSGTGRTPLSYAAEAGYPKWLQFLIEKGAQVNRADSAARTPLHYAVVSKSGIWGYETNDDQRERSEEEIRRDRVKILLANGGEMKVQDPAFKREKQMPLRRHCSVSGGFLDHYSRSERERDNSWKWGTILDSEEELEEAQKDSRSRRYSLGWSKSRGDEAEGRGGSVEVENWPIR